MKISKEKLNFSYDVSTIGSYVDQVSDELIATAIAGSNTAQMVTVLPNVKGTKALNLMGGVLDLEARACTSTAGSGTVALTQRTITVKDLQVKEEFCPSNLHDTWLSMKMAPGSTNDSIPFEQAIADFKMKQIQKTLDYTYWQGNSANSAATYQLFDGFYTLLSAATNRVKITGSTITSSNVIDIVDDVIDSIPEDIQDEEVMIFMGHNIFRLLVAAWRNENYYSYNVDGMESWKFKIPGTTVTAVAVTGLNGTNYLIASTANNLFIGTDILDEANQFTMKYSDYHDTIAFRVYFKAGVQIAYDEYCICNF